jgi:hypothetical protein
VAEVPAPVAAAEVVLEAAETPVVEAVETAEAVVEAEAAEAPRAE